MSDRLCMLAEAAKNGANRLHVAVNDRLTVKDRSILFDGKGPMTDGQVSVKEDGSVLIHPDTRALVVAELTGLGLYGSVRYELLLRLENAKAAATEVRVVATQEPLVIPRTVAVYRRRAWLGRGRDRLGSPQGRRRRRPHARA